MRFIEWSKLWRIDKTIKIPHADIVVMTPYLFVRVLWYFNRRPFEAHPSTYETGVVIGWRCPWKPSFNEKQWIRHHNMHVAIYGGPMDAVYLGGAVMDLGMDLQPLSGVNIESTRHIGEVAKDINKLTPSCSHPYWIASCPTCARKAFMYALALKPSSPRIQETEEQRRKRIAEDLRLGRPSKTIAEAEEELVNQAISHYRKLLESGRG